MQQVVKEVDEHGQQGSKEHLQWPYVILQKIRYGCVTETYEVALLVNQLARLTNTVVTSVYHHLSRHPVLTSAGAGS